VALALLLATLMPATKAAAAADSYGYLGVGCWNVWINDSLTWGITLASVHLEADNICIVYNLYGYWVIYSNPSGWAHHYNNPVVLLWCGYDGSTTGDWLPNSVNLAWGVAPNADFLSTTFWQTGCNPYLETIDHAGIWVYAGDTNPFHPPLLINTHDNWSGP
jgi:hypothetical protein